MVRHRLNQRQHDSIIEDYVEVMVVDGLVEGVAGEPWGTPSENPEDPEEMIHLLSFASRATAYYICKERSPDAYAILRTEEAGLKKHSCLWDTLVADPRRRCNYSH